MSTLELWLLVTVMPKVLAFSVITLVLSSIFLTFLISCNLDGVKDDEIPSYLRWCIKTSGIFLISLILVVSLPTQRQLAIIVGGSYISNVEGVEELSPNTVKAVNRLLEEYTD